MLAVRFHETGAPEVLQTDEIEAPEPAPGEIQVEVHAVGVNRADVLARGNLLPWPVRLPHTLGADIAGVVAKLGPGVPGPALGTRVVVNPYVGCGVCRLCKLGRNNVCARSEVIGLQRDGGYAEYATVPASAVVPLPDKVAFDVAASVVLTGLTAWHLLVTRARLRATETVLVRAAGSGVGSLGVQIAKALGARVFATVGSEEKRAPALALGAEQVFLDDDPQLVRSFKARSEGGADVVFEHVGAATWRTSLAALARGGRVAECGGHSGFEVGIHLAVLSAKEQEVIGSYGGTASELDELMAALDRGLIRPVIANRYPLTQAAAAHAAMESRSHFGKLVLLKENQP